MDQAKFFVQKSSLIRKNTMKFTEVYSYDPLTDKLGQGAYGTVYKCVHKQSKQVRAVKVINKSNVKQTERLVHEITIMELMVLTKKLFIFNKDHPNILKLFETFEDEQSLYMIIELCSGGDVFDKVLEKGNLTVEEAFTLFIQYMKTILYYQQFHIVHRDLKPENFLFLDKKNEMTLNVIDFGIAKKYKPGMGNLKTKSGTVKHFAYYVAPEVLDGNYTDKCDIWSAGVILYVLLCGYPPFYGENEKEILMEIKHGNLQFEGEEWDIVDQQVKDFIGYMISPAKIRWTAKELLEFDLSQHFLKKHFYTNNLLLNKMKLEKWQKYPQLKKVALLYHATQLDYKQCLKYKTTFFTLNSSQSGMISKEEFGKHFPKQLFDGLDCNNNGFIDYFEYIAAVMDLDCYNSDNDLKTIFQFLSDNQKTIKKEGINKIMEEDNSLEQKWNSLGKVGADQRLFDQHVKVRTKPSMSTAAAVIKEVQKKTDEITYEEFKNMMIK